jgi:uncharacterized protein YbdZ (MbtH family)
MKYIAQPDGAFAVIDETSELFAQLSALPAGVRPVFLAASSKAVKDYFAAQAEAMKPKEVTMRQARLALLQAGLLDRVTATIAGMPSPQKQAAEIEWEYSNSLKRSQPLVTQLGAALGLDAAALDLLFSTASKL